MSLFERNEDQHILVGTILMINLFLSDQLFFCLRLMTGGKHCENKDRLGMGARREG